MKQKLSMVTLGVRDVIAARKFYEDVLELKPTDASSETVAFYEMGGVMLGLFGEVALAEDAGVSVAGDGFRRVTLAHNEPSREAVDELFVVLKEKGVRIVKKPVEVFWGGYSGYFADPDGHLWEVAHNPLMDLT